MASAVPLRRSLPSDLAKTLPHNLDAERNVLGAVLLDNVALKRATPYVKAADFFHPGDGILSDNGKLFLAMITLASDGKPIEYVSLIDHMKSDQIQAAYIQTLADGMPRVSNVEYYAKLVAEKSRLREIIRRCYAVQESAYDKAANPDELLSRLEHFARGRVSTSDNPMVVVGCRELLTLDMPQPNFIMEPLLTEGGSMMIFSWAGVGKSFITTEMAAHIAMGLPKIFVWPIPQAYRVMYLYGEMHGGEIRKRWQQIAKGNGLELPEDSQLGFVSKEFQRIARAPRCAYDWRPSISTPNDRRIVEDRLAQGEYKVVVFDNASTLWPASQDKSSDREAVLKDWFIDLNQNGIAVIYLQHAGKSGDFLGDSQQIHILDSVLKLWKPADYDRRVDQLRACVRVDKVRGESTDRRYTTDFELSLSTDVQAGAVWLTRPLRNAQKKLVFEDLSNGMSAQEIARAYEIPPRTIYNWRTEWKKNTDFKQWLEEE